MATNTVAADEIRAASAGGEYSTFYVGGLFFGIDVLQVQEVLRYQAAVEGLINLRGQIVTAIDMRRRLQQPPRAEGETPMNMVIRTEDGAVSLLVDEIGDVIEVDPETYEPSPENVDPVVKDLLRGVHKLDGRLLLLLDTEKTVDLSAGEAASTRSR